MLGSIMELSVGSGLFQTTSLGTGSIAFARLDSLSSAIDCVHAANQPATSAGVLVIMASTACTVSCSSSQIALYTIRCLQQGANISVSHIGVGSPNAHG